MSQDSPKWKRLANASKAHLFMNGRSLCLKWMYIGSDYDSEWNGRSQRGDCKACVRIAQKFYPKETVDDCGRAKEVVEQ